jgi:hypothetical protein
VIAIVMIEMLNLLSLIVLMQVSVLPAKPLKSYGFSIKSNVCPYEFCKYPCSYHKKRSKYDWQNIYSKETLSFSWIKNPTIK